MLDVNNDDQFSNTYPHAFGRQMRRHFLFNEHYINLNHGSFGTYPSQIRDTLRSYQDLAEARPDPFIRYEYPKLLDRSRALMASYVNVPEDEIVFVPNATTGINTVLRNLRFEEGDKILYCATIYGACEKTVDYICETTPAESLCVEYEYPLSDDELVQRFRDTMRRAKECGGKVKVAIFDVVVSLPGVRMPFEQLTELCREEGVLSLIDGAHGLGHIALNLGKLQPDFFVANCHKWLFAPRGCAVLHVPRKHQALIRSAIPTSHGFVSKGIDGRVINNPLPSSRKSQFITQFEFTGALDTTPYLCIPECFKFINEFCGGEERVMHYCQSIAQQGGAFVAAMLGTEVMENKEGTLQKCFFSNVRLPLQVGHEMRAIDPNNCSKVTQWLTATMVDDYNTFMALILHRGAWWIRFSGQIYLEMKDFEWAGQVLRDLCQRVKNGEYLEHGHPM